jgi:hypothetical protein
MAVVKPKPAAKRLQGGQVAQVSPLHRCVMSVQVSISTLESSTRTQRSQQSLKTRSLRSSPPGGEDRGGCGTPHYEGSRRAGTLALVFERLPQ